MSAAQAIRLFLVDDHPVVRAGLRSIEQMSEQIRVVGEAGSAPEALPLILGLRPDVVLLDLRLPGGSGIDLCRQIKTSAPSTRVLILTSYADSHLILAALEAGTDGYLLKESDTQRLVHAITMVQRGETVFGPHVTQELADRKRNRGGHPVSSLACLTPQERRLLAEVAKGKTDKEAAAQLGLTAKTARNYLDRIFTKLGVHTRTGAATAYIRAGERVWEE